MPSRGVFPRNSYTSAAAFNTNPASLMTANLQNRSFGKTGEQITALGLGGGWLDRSSYAEGVATVRRALELGVTYFDTSPMYCRGVSQMILGDALEGRSEKHLLATKLGYFADPGHFRSIPALHAQLEDNLRRLRRTQVDVLQVHEADWACWWNDEIPPGQPLKPDRSYNFANAPVVQVLREAKANGRCRFIGITGNNAEIMGHVLSQVDVDAILVAFNYSLLFRGARRFVLPLACRKETAFIAGAAFQGGRLSEVHPDWITSPPSWVTAEIQVRLHRLYDLQASCGLTLVNLAIRYLLADPSISTILIGAATPAQLEESVAAAQQGCLPPDLHQAIEKLGLPPGF